jgi:hypothetical protein
MYSKMAMITFFDAGEAPTNPIALPPVYPSQGLPGSPAYPSQGLPGISPRCRSIRSIPRCRRMTCRAEDCPRRSRLSPAGSLW